LLYELEKTLERESRDGGASYLIPITLDRFVFDSWSPKRAYLREEILSRVVADFGDPALHEHQMQRLISALRKPALTK
jgi:hypothetical protein